MHAAGIATTPEPPYYAVIFTTRRSAGDHGYAAMADKMAELASQQPGYLGAESAREDGGVGITVSYWKDEASASKPGSRSANTWAPSASAKSAGTRTTNSASPKSNAPTPARRDGDAFVQSLTRPFAYPLCCGLSSAMTIPDANGACTAKDQNERSPP